MMAGPTPGRALPLVEEEADNLVTRSSFEYKVRDRHNWDNGKFACIGDQR